jgi:hypothetical protein
MRSLENEVSAEVWNATQQRRTEDLTEWFRETSKRFKKPVSNWRPMSQVATRPGLWLLPLLSLR